MKICIFCSSSIDVEEEYKNAAIEVGKQIAERGHSLVYGGGRVGLMNLVASNVRENKAKIIGIIPHKLGEVVKDFDETIFVDDIYTRVKLMERESDGFLALPGGIGTMQEIYSVLTTKQLGFHNKPIVVLNTKDYFRNFLNLNSNAVEEGFLEACVKDYFFVSESIHNCFNYLRDYRPVEIEDKMKRALEQEGLK